MSRLSFPGSRRTLPSLLILPAVALCLTGCFAFAEYDADRSFGVGVRGQVDLDRVLPMDRDEDGGGLASRLGVAGGIHLFTPDEGDVLQANVDLMVPLLRLGDGAARSYAGTGVSLARISSGDDPSWDPGLNLLGGVQFERRTFAPFFEARGGLGGATTFSAVVGVRIASP